MIKPTGNGYKQNETGNATEKFVSKTFRLAGFQSYRVPKTASGQPCDIFAFKNNKAWEVDVKHVREEEVSFPFKRIEPNQISSFTYAKNFAQMNKIGFVIFFERDKTLYWFPFSLYEELIAQGKKSVNMSLLKPFNEVLNDEGNN